MRLCLLMLGTKALFILIVIASRLGCLHCEGEIMGLLVAIIVIIIISIVNSYRKRREQFVRESSTALKSLMEINTKHSFLNVPCFDMDVYYDNEDYYDTISPLDYLTYQLVYKQKAIIKAVKDAAVNNARIIPYQTEVASCLLGNFSLDFLSENQTGLEKLLQKYWLTKDYNAICAVEKSLFNATVKRPVIAIHIQVCLYLTNIKGRQRDIKSATFNTPVILEAINKLQQKTNGFYSDPEVWHAICRVERGKVSNRMRFAVYNRDGNRCRKCGSTQNLEVDHIFPISKGGKSTFDNLQTLCHRCNVAKGNFIEPDAVPPRNVQSHSKRMCPNCHIPLVKRIGSYGEFWGCPNYPRCRYTQNK